MPVTFEQAKRLKEAGYPLKEIVKGEYENPDEKEMMEYLKPHMMQIALSGKEWDIVLANKSAKVKYITHPDLTEALVEACVRVLESKKEEGR